MKDRGIGTAALVGVDGAGGGWVAVHAHADGLGFAVFADAGALTAAFAAARVIAVDIPMGLSDASARAADAQARRFVGGHRASSIFPSPVRGILDAQSQAEASRLHRLIDGRGFGAQSFAILPKIRQWDTVLRASERDRERCFEVHPEVSFAALNGGFGLAARKKSPEGARQRRDLLGHVFGFDAVDALLARVPRSGAAADDVLDAAAALWSARRIAAGVAVALPSPPPRDAAGIRMAIHY